jgi:hypothetical protein
MFDGDDVIVGIIEASPLAKWIAKKNSEGWLYYKVSIGHYVPCYMGRFSNTKERHKWVIMGYEFEHHTNKILWC